MINDRPLSREKKDATSTFFFYIMHFYSIICVEPDTFTFHLAYLSLMLASVQLYRFW